MSKLSDQLSEATKEWMLAERRFEDLRVENEKLEEKMSEAAKENEKLQQKLIILEQDWQHESNLYSKSCHRVIELERKETTLLSQSREVHNKLVEEKKRSQELEEEIV